MVLPPFQSSSKLTDISEKRDVVGTDIRLGHVYDRRMEGSLPVVIVSVL